MDNAAERVKSISLGIIKAYSKAWVLIVEVWELWKLFLYF